MDLEKETCNCKSWDLIGILCTHTLCAKYHDDKEPEDYMKSWYRKDTYLNSYNFSIQPMRGKKLWPPTKNEPLKPPEEKKMLNRPKRNRKRARMNPKKMTS